MTFKMPSVIVLARHKIHMLGLFKEYIGILGSFLTIIHPHHVVEQVDLNMNNLAHYFFVVQSLVEICREDGD